VGALRILWVKAGKLLPVDSGGKIRSYNILRHLRRQHELVLLSYYGGHKDEEYEREIREHIPGAVPLWTAALDQSPWARALDYLGRFPGGAPFAVSKFTSGKVQCIVSRWMAEHRFDVAVCDFLSASRNFPHRPATPTVLFQHNVEAVLWRRMAACQEQWLRKTIYRLEARRMERYERAAVQRFDRVIAVSDRDKALMTAYLNPERITVVPTGVDLSEFHPVPGQEASDPLIVFVGSMDFDANEDGVHYFCRQIWPRIRAQLPQARFRVVGRNPSAAVKSLACGNIEIIGRVTSIREHLRQAWVLVVPLRVGGGTRLKIYEGMAMGKAVVSTSVGAEGLEVRHGCNIFLADDPHHFADAVVMMVRRPELRRQYEKAAAVQASKFDWSNIAGSFAGVLRDVVQAKDYRSRPATDMAAVHA